MDWSWRWNSSTLSTWCKELTHWKRSWCCEGMKARGEGDDKGWDGWMALGIQWTWVSASSGSWWWTGKPSVLQSMGLHRVVLGAALGIADKMEEWPQHPLFFPQARTQDEGVRPCDSDLFFPLLGWVDRKGILRCLLFLRGAWEGTKPSAAVLRE